MICQKPLSVASIAVSGSQVIEPYYPVNDSKNSLLYNEYRELANAEENVIFGGRLGEYKYYDMDQVIAAALTCVEREIK